MDKKTKIVATIGPATTSKERLKELLLAGMNVMRLNFSHGDFAEHQERLDNLRSVSEELNVPVAVMQDLGGPKIRIGNFSTESITLKKGATFTLTTESIVGDEHRVYVNYPLLPKEVKKGGFILLHDGKKKLQITDVKGNEVVCTVIVGGDIKGRRGVNLPGAYLSISSLTEKDRKDLEFGIKNKIDYVALSFVRRAGDIAELRAILKKAKLDAGIISKIETPEAVENIDQIIELSDAIMLARGDLAIEIPAEDVPLVQKMIIKKCNKAGKPVITATQMLESMIKSPVPTRAEVSDIANAILDGTDAVMLSEETTLGQFPVEAVSVMARVAKRVEGDYLLKQFLNGTPSVGETHGVGESITASAVRNSDRIGARLIISLSESGYSSRMISRHKPTQPILVFTPNETTFHHVVLSFGCFPVLVKRFKTFNDIEKVILAYCLKNKLAKAGDKIVIASGMPFGKAVETNMLVVETL